jgi:hypothetical protein
MAKPKTIGPDPWIGFVPVVRPKPERMILPAGALYIRALTPDGITQQAAVLGLEVVGEVIHQPHHPVHAPYGAWAVPAGDDS